MKSSLGPNDKNWKSKNRNFANSSFGLIWGIQSQPKCPNRARTKKSTLQISVLLWFVKSSLGPNAKNWKRQKANSPEFRIALLGDIQCDHKCQTPWPFLFLLWLACVCWPSHQHLDVLGCFSAFFALVFLNLFTFPLKWRPSMSGFLRRVKKKLKKKYYKKENGEKGGSTSQMDDANRAICYALRHPPAGEKPMPLNQIQKMVHKKGNKKERPTLKAISLAAQNYNKKKGLRGRPKGSTVTTKAEDKKIIQVFHKLRPAGHYVDSRKIHNKLPKALQKKIGRKTVIRCFGVSTNCWVWLECITFLPSLALFLATLLFSPLLLLFYPTPSPSSFHSLSPSPSLPLSFALASLPDCSFLATSFPPSYFLSFFLFIHSMTHCIFPSPQICFSLCWFLWCSPPACCQEGLHLSRETWQRFRWRGMAQEAGHFLHGQRGLVCWRLETGSPRLRWYQRVYLVPQRLKAEVQTGTVPQHLHE